MKPKSVRSFQNSRFMRSRNFNRSLKFICFSYFHPRALSILLQVLMTLITRPIRIPSIHHRLQFNIFLFDTFFSLSFFLEPRANSRRQIELKERNILVARDEDIFRSHAEQICQKLSNKLILTVGLSSDSETWFNVFARGKKNSCPTGLRIFPYIVSYDFDKREQNFRDNVRLQFIYSSRSILLLLLKIVLQF